jgi:hypothetical protein
MCPSRRARLSVALTSYSSSPNRPALILTHDAPTEPGVIAAVEVGPSCQTPPLSSTPSAEPHRRPAALAPFARVLQGSAGHGAVRPAACGWHGVARCPGAAAWRPNGLPAWHARRLACAATRRVPPGVPCVARLASAANVVRSRRGSPAWRPDAARQRGFHADMSPRAPGLCAEELRSLAIVELVDALAIFVYVKELAVAQTSERCPARPAVRPARPSRPAHGRRAHGLPTTRSRALWRSPRARRHRRSPEQRLATSFVVAMQQGLRRSRRRRDELRLPRFTLRLLRAQVVESSPETGRRACATACELGVVGV